MGLTSAPPVEEGQRTPGLYGLPPLNAPTKKNSYLLPRINDSLQVLGGSKHSLVLDLNSGYYQGNLSP